ncbi:thiamine pyrophosphate-binding protein [Saccharopolyspora erythraea]|nr:thiamine pyrophosphate-binding protein [Saccharopolyspora erythraea]
MRSGTRGRAAHGAPRSVDVLVRGLAAAGVSHVFGVGGANIEDLYDALHTSPAVTGVLAKHEFSAAAMADGHARVTGGLGVVAATSGGGALNLVPALGESFASRVPVLALIGQPPTGIEGRGAFQDTSGAPGCLDAEAVFGAVARYCARLDAPDDLQHRLAEAIEAALAPPGGPAVLLLPKDVQQARVTGCAGLPRPRAEVAPHNRELPHAVGVLEEARRTGGVLVIAGDDVARRGARDDLARLVDALDARVAVAPDGKDAFDNGDPRFVGVSGVMGHPTVTRALRASSACLLVGTRLPVVARDGIEHLLAERPVVAVSRERPHIGSIVLPGDLAPTLRSLTHRLRGRPAPRSQQPPGVERYPGARPAGGGIGYVEAMAVIEAALPRGARLFVDAGNCGAAAIHHLAVPRGGRFVVAMGMGGMGYTFGAAIGASFADSAEVARTFVIAGDGAFYMHGLEVHTAVEHGLPITFIVLNNNAHAMCVTREQLHYGGGYSYNRFAGTSIAAGVNAMFPSLEARNATTALELADALVATGSAPGPAFISVDCDADEMPPVAAFLREGMIPCQR